jgi:hypothetical protein
MLNFKPKKEQSTQKLTKKTKKSTTKSITRRHQTTTLSTTTTTTKPLFFTQQSHTLFSQRQTTQATTHDKSLLLVPHTGLVSQFPKNHNQHEQIHDLITATTTTKSTTKFITRRHQTTTLPKVFRVTPPTLAGNYNMGSNPSFLQVKRYVVVFLKKNLQLFPPFSFIFLYCFISFFSHYYYYYYYHDNNHYQSPALAFSLSLLRSPIPHFTSFPSYVPNKPTHHHQILSLFSLILSLFYNLIVWLLVITHIAIDQYNNNNLI